MPRSLSLTRNGFDPSEDFVLYFEDAGTCNPWLFGSTNHCASGKWVSGVSAGGPIAFQDSFDFNPKFELQIDPEKGTKSGEVRFLTEIPDDFRRFVDEIRLF